MKVFFIYTNVNGFHENCYSPGLAYIVSSTRASGHDTKVSIIRNRSEYTRVVDEIGAFMPRVIGFTAVSSQFAAVKEIAKLVKANFNNMMTICGGVHPTINPECILEAESLDGIFIGESEHAFVEFLQMIEDCMPYETSDNFAYVRDGKLVRNRLKPLIHDLDILPYPDKDIYPYRAAIEAAGYAPFFFSRGCPYMCSYCCNHAIARTYGLSLIKTRYRSAESSIREMEDALSRFPMKRIVIRDDIFGLNRKWREEFCREYKNRIDKPFSVFSRVDVVNKEYIGVLKDAGCCSISLAIESGNDFIRNKVMNKGISKHQIVKAFDLARSYGLETSAINLIGIPGETEAMIWDTIKLNRHVKPTSSRANIFYPYKGTTLGDSCFTLGLVEETAYGNFFNERRESVLNYPEEHKKKLIYYHKNWEKLVNSNSTQSGTKNLPTDIGDAR